MVLDAMVFLAGAVLFLLAVLFFLYTWRERTTVAQIRQELEARQEALRQQRVEVDLREHELNVWAQGLEQEQRALELERAALRMLTTDEERDGGGMAPEGEGEERRTEAPPATVPIARSKNRKLLEGKFRLP